MSDLASINASMKTLKKFQYYS